MNNQREIDKYSIESTILTVGIFSSNNALGSIICAAMLVVFLFLSFAAYMEDKTKQAEEK